MLRVFGVNVVMLSVTLSRLIFTRKIMNMKLDFECFTWVARKCKTLVALVVSEKHTSLLNGLVNYRAECFIE
jgi:hypothetical protein